MLLVIELNLKKLRFHCFLSQILKNSGFIVSFSNSSHRFCFQNVFPFHNVRLSFLIHFQNQNLKILYWIQFDRYDIFKFVHAKIKEKKKKQNLL